ncbi:hypothetical protein ACJJTC_000989 [Scirpophaga incertulas]
MTRANRKYILTQGPLAFTVGHFWLMVWEQNSRAILMLNKIIEKNEIKCHWYWPHGLGEANKVTYDDVQLTVEQISEQELHYYTIRRFRLVDMETGDIREVVQYHYTTWPDFGVPTSPLVFLNFLKKVRDSGVLDAEAGPPVVHCSAGIGRSGTFCLVDSCLVLIEKGETNINPQEILLEMRRDRMGLIQTPDQLRFSYQAIIEGAKRLDPDYKEPEDVAKMEDSVYSTVENEAEEEAPPPPPPRGASLVQPPARPLPAIPNSTSLGNLSFTARAESSSSDEEPPTPPPRESTPTVSSTDDEDDEATEVTADSNEAAATLRRRKTRELADRVSAMKRRARNAEKWHALKRSLYKPLTITFGVLLAGILIYSYVKH